MNNNDLSFSTSWNWRNGLHHGYSGEQLMQEIIELGFNQVELNYKITEEMIKSIFPMIEKGQINISSVHNVFPYVEGTTYDTDSMLLGYADDEKRKQSVAYTKRSVDYAHYLGAKAVVIHPGAVPLHNGLNYNVLLKNLYNEGKKETEEYNRLFQDMMNHRTKWSAKYTGIIKQSLEEVAEYIMKKNYDVALGIENRAMCHQIPDFKEATWLLDELSGLPVYFWYDVGHGIMMDNLGMFDNKKEVYKLKGKILGVHIHDAVGVDDHWSPYTKSNVLDDFLELFQSIPIKVLELGCKNSKEDIKSGVAIFNKRRQDLV